MPTPTPAPPAIPVAPLEGADWLAARASLAARRTGRFTRLWLLILGPLTALALLIPLSGGGPERAERSGRARLVADTVRTGQVLRRAERSAAAAESTMIAAIATLSAPAVPAGRVPAPPRRAAPAPTPPPTNAPTTGGSPALVALETGIREARRLRTPAAWLTVAADPTVSGGPRMRALADSLTLLTRQRDALPAGPSRDELAAPLSRTINRLGYTIIAIAENRRGELAAAGGGAPPPAAAVAPPPVPRAEPAPAVVPATADATVPRPDTVVLGARLRAVRDTVAGAERAHSTALAALAAAGAATTTEGSGSLAALTPGLVLLALLLVGLAVRLGGALRKEMKTPTLSGAVETERVVGLPVLATVRDNPLDGPARFRPSGVDPFRMLYLGLTATGTRARTMIVTGEDPVVVAAVGARLAISAAADHRTTLVMDLDPRSIALSRTLRERAEPGLTDALAGAFQWREVARPIGSSDGLPITLLPAGTERDDLATGDALVAQREALTKFRAAYDFTILIGPVGYLDQAVALVESSPIVVTASVGETLVDRFTADGAELKSSGRRVHGVVLWDAPAPALPSRAELAALLSKQKGRTPGGSFAAVKKAIGEQKKGQ